MANNALELTGEVDVISQAKVPYINFISSLNDLNSHTLCIYFVHGVPIEGRAAGTTDNSNHCHPAPIQECSQNVFLGKCIALVLSGHKSLLARLQ